MTATLHHIACYFSLVTPQYHKVFLSNNKRQQRVMLMPGLRRKQIWSRTEGKHGIVKQCVELLVSHCCSIKFERMSTVTSHHVYHAAILRTAKTTSTTGSTYVNRKGQTFAASLKCDKCHSFSGLDILNSLRFHQCHLWILEDNLNWQNGQLKGQMTDMLTDNRYNYCSPRQIRLKTNR